LLPALLREFKWARTLRDARNGAARRVQSSTRWWVRASCRSCRRACGLHSSGCAANRRREPLSPGALGVLSVPILPPCREWTRVRERGCDFHFRDTRDSRTILYDALASQDSGAYLMFWRAG
jgi:hypothetical protein